MIYKQTNAYVDYVKPTEGPGGPTLPEAPGKPVAPYKHNETAEVKNHFHYRTCKSNKCNVDGTLTGGPAPPRAPLGPEGPEAPC